MSLGEESSITHLDATTTAASDIFERQHAFHNIHEPLPPPLEDQQQCFAGLSSSVKKKATKIPHRGSLYRIDPVASKTSGLTYQYVIQILLENGETHKLIFDRHDFEFISNLFAILDTESRGLVDRTALEEFVTLRCPVFWRRDEDLRKSGADTDIAYDSSSPTFNEVWSAVCNCGKDENLAHSNVEIAELGVEGWMVFCRFIVLAQYLEAKRQFSARHLQQTMRHRNSPRGSEVVVVDVPPPEAPIKLTPIRLAEHERKSNSPLPLPELDLDHSLISAHDALRNRSISTKSRGIVKITLFGTKPKKILSPTTDIDFALTYETNNIIGEEMIVRRSFSDLKWLNQTFKLHQGLGGTLCGRILPPFPASSSNSLAKQFQPNDQTLQSAIDTTGAAVKAAAAGVGMIKNVAKSIWGSYGPLKFGNEKKAVEKHQMIRKPTKKVSSTTKVAISEKFYNPHSPTVRARQLERYLNYLLEHPALSASFPLNTILKASQSGLNAAKLFLEDHAQPKNNIHIQASLLDDWRITPTPSSSTSTGGGVALSRQLPNLRWVRTAAQAAMALKVHGLLETTGLPSASARLQHASLPNFNQSARNSGWVDEDGSSLIQENPSASSEDSVEEGAENFEHGVVNVEGETDGDGYDLLPLPIPAPERLILCAGSAPVVSSGEVIYDGTSSEFNTQEERFHYGVDGEKISLNQHCEVESAFLGDFQVDDNIDKLREVIGSVDSTLSRCLSACGSIGTARRKEISLNLTLVRGFDSWEGLRGRFIAQRALLKGVTGLEQSREIAEESDLDIVDDISWQSALASSAVTAAEDVRSTVRAARTAANAKAAADSATFAAQNACEGGFQSIDEARAAQTRLSMAQSHAIHAAVVEHEANTAKRRAALALAHDVKCWNVHRKRELLQSCLSYAKSQHVATRRAVDAWSCLRDGYLGSNIMPDARVSALEHIESINDYSDVAQIPSASSSSLRNSEEEPVAQIYSEISPDMVSAIGSPTIEAVDHLILSAPIVLKETNNNSTDKDTSNKNTKDNNHHADFFHAPLSDPKFSDESNKALSSIEEGQDLPIIDADPIRTVGTIEREPSEESEPDNALTSSMQSLVDGLMSWGGQYDTEEDLSLPVGMAASIVLEGSTISGNE